MSQTKAAVMRSSLLLGVKVFAFSLTGSAVLMAALVDSMVDVVASGIAHFVKPREHHEEHQLALIQAAWIVLGGALVMLESMRHFNEPVDMAFAGIGILMFTLVIDGSIVRKLDSSSPVIQALKEDIKADMFNSLGGLVALGVIAFGAPMQVDKVIAIIISAILMLKGGKLFKEHFEAVSADHLATHRPGEGGVPSPLDYSR
jgi:ferrous-iron efflux pump FieF